MKTIKESLPYDELLSQISEEAAELSAICAKAARIRRGVNVSPMTLEDALLQIREEFTDVCLCAEVAGITVNQMIKYAKMRRWEDRLNHGNKIEISP